MLDKLKQKRFQIEIQVEEISLKLERLKKHHIDLEKKLRNIDLEIERLKNQNKRVSSEDLIDLTGFTEEEKSNILAQIDEIRSRI